MSSKIKLTQGFNFDPAILGGFNRSYGLAHLFELFEGLMFSIELLHLLHEIDASFSSTVILANNEFVFSVGFSFEPYIIRRGTNVPASNNDISCLNAPIALVSLKGLLSFMILEGISEFLQSSLDTLWIRILNLYYRIFRNVTLLQTESLNNLPFAHKLDP